MDDSNLCHSKQAKLKRSVATSTSYKHKLFANLLNLGLHREVRRRITPAMQKGILPSYGPSMQRSCWNRLKWSKRFRCFSGIFGKTCKILFRNIIFIFSRKNKYIYIYIWKRNVLKIDMQLSCHNSPDEWLVDNKGFPNLGPRLLRTVDPPLKNTWVGCIHGRCLLTLCRPRWALKSSLDNRF